MYRRASALLLALALSIAPAALQAASNPDPSKAPAGRYVVHPQHAHLILSGEHLGFSHFTFRFDKIDAHYDYDPAKPDATKVFVQIDTASFSSGTKATDERFVGDHFLNVVKFPTITYVVDEIHRTSPTQGTITGNLTFMGVTKRFTMDTKFYGWGPGPGAEARFMKMAFSAKGAFKRSDFGFATLPTLFGDDIAVQVEIEFLKSDGNDKG